MMSCYNRGLLEPPGEDFYSSTTLHMHFIPRGHKNTSERAFFKCLYSKYQRLLIKMSTFNDYFNF